MKHSFKKLRDFALSKHGFKEPPPISHSELAEPSQDVKHGMQDVENMRAQYEGLLTNANIISGAAYDFSRSLQDMASYMVGTFGQISDGEIGNIFSMLGKVQFEISKLLDIYVSHVSQTIITPTKSMISELQQVEVMRGLYEEKRELYNLIQKERRKGKPKNGKGDNLEQRLALAKEVFEEQANVLSFRLQSLKQGQSLSLVTQAARYHTAQIHLFSKGLASINALEPVMRQLAMEKNIDRTLADGVVGIHDNMHEMELDGNALENGGESESIASSPRYVQESQQMDAEETFEAVPMFKKSAPAFPCASFQNEYIEHIQDISVERPAHKRSSTYALPSPSGTSGRWLDDTAGLVSSQTHTSTQGFGSQLPSIKNEFRRLEETENYNSKIAGQHNSKPSHDVKKPLFLGEHKADLSTNLFPPSTKGQNVSMQSANHQRKSSANGRLMTFPEVANNGDFDTFPKISKRYSHSGPLAARNLANGKHTTVHNDCSMPFHSPQVSFLLKSASISRTPMPVNTPPLISQSISPPFLSPPRISELHKLPPPPEGLSTPPKSASLVAYSAPLGRKAQEAPSTSGPASPLPPPPPAFVTRSLSIPSSANHHHSWQQGNMANVQTLEEDF